MKPYQRVLFQPPFTIEYEKLHNGRRNDRFKYVLSILILKRTPARRERQKAHAQQQLSKNETKDPTRCRVTHRTVREN